MLGAAKASARDAGMRGRNIYNKVSNAIAQIPRKHATITAPILSSFMPFASQASELASLTKRSAPHVIESKNKTENIAISTQNKAQFKCILKYC